MKAKINLHQQSADKMRAKILQAAQTLFVEKGFSGTSISAIAKLAGINQSLIYHYFASKEDLWRDAKSQMILSTLGMEDAHEIPTIETLDQLLDHLVRKRFNLYLKNRNLVRMLQWQMLEETSSILTGTSKEWMDLWLSVIKSLQKKKLISAGFAPEEIMVLINGMILSPFLSETISERCSEEFGQKIVLMLKQALDTKR